VVTEQRWADAPIEVGRILSRQGGIDPGSAILDTCSSCFTAPGNNLQVLANRHLSLKPGGVFLLDLKRKEKGSDDGPNPRTF
jgi:hypothetical protein